MEHYLIWTKGLFESNYQIFSGTQIKNSLFFDTWKNEARGIATATSYLFKTNGWINPITQIIDEKGMVIGQITYNSWQTKAAVTLHGEQLAWHFINSWRSQWTLSDLKHKQIFYDSNSQGGKIAANTDDEIMLLTGLFISAYYNRIFILIVLLGFILVLTRGVF